MKKIKTRKLLSTIVCICACTAIAIPASLTPAVAAPPVLPQSIRSEIGGNIRHDSQMMKDKKHEKETREDYEKYERAKDPASQGVRSEASQIYNSGTDAIRATVEEIDTKGLYVNSIQVSPSEILSSGEITPIIRPLIGKNIFISDLQNVIDQINDLYATKGYVTARAFLPEQTVQNGNIYIELMESKIGNITVQNNRWTKSKYITDRMPEDTGELFDIVELEQNILDFNRYNEGVNLTANLRAGTRAGTTDVELVANENFPFHLVGVMDNAGRTSTGSIRGGAMLYADSLFGRRDQMSIGSYFSGGAVSPFFDYNVPVNKRDGRMGFMFASTLAEIKYGGYDWMEMKTRGYQYSLYYSQPIVRKPGFELKTYSALNYKRARTSSGVGDLIGAPDPFKSTDQVTSAEVALQMRKDTKRGIWYLNQGAYYSIPILNSYNDNNYWKVSGGLVRLHDFSHGVVGQIRSNYQFVPGDKNIPYLDQIQAGGLATIRGYSEGVMIGKNGYYVTSELMFPLLPREITSPRTGQKIPFIGKYIKGALFYDTAGIFPTAKGDIYDGSYFLMSVGAGLRVQLPGDLTGRIYWGFPLISNKWQGDNKMGRIHFELSLSPDVDALLRGRSTALQTKIEEKNVEADIYRNYEDIRHYDYFYDGGGGSL